MHVSVATLTSCHLLANIPMLGNWVWLFPILIAISAVKTKQHYVYDLLPGALLGLIVYWIFGLIY
jgi:membrane-associated phospholipid phosphatase